MVERGLVGAALEALVGFASHRQHRNPGGAGQFLQGLPIADRDVPVGHAALVEQLARLCAGIAGFRGVQRDREIPDRLLQSVGQWRRRALAARGRFLLHVLGVRRRHLIRIMHIAAVVDPAVQLGMRERWEQQ